MKYFIKLFICFLFVISFSEASYSTDYNDFINNNKCDQILDNVFYKTCYSYRAKGALYTYYKLDGEKVNSVNIKKRPSFKTDKRIPKKYRSYASDYIKNKQKADRGHLSPDASFDYSNEALKSVYLMSNIIPQYKRINRHTWKKAEKRERSLAKRMGSVEVINGVGYDENTIFIKGVLYPTYFWKMIYNNKELSECFIFYNKKISKEDVKLDVLSKHKIDCSLLTS